MRQRILKMSPIAQLIRADQNAVICVEPARLSCRASATPHVAFVDAGAAVCGAQEVDFGLEEADDGAVFEEPGFVFFAAGAVGGFVGGVPGAEVGFSFRWGGVAGHYAEEGRPGVD